MSVKTTIDTLITTKLHRPAVDGIHVHRPHLLERLDQRRGRPLTLVSAPAGYGKSVLIRSWLESCDIPGAWVSLDKNDNDLRMFTAYFVAAVEALFCRGLPEYSSPAECFRSAAHRGFSRQTAERTGSDRAVLYHGIQNPVWVVGQLGNSQPL